jgi:hypothetical protein
MNRNPPGRDQHHVETLVHAGKAGTGLHEGLSRADDAGGLAGVEGFHGPFMVLTGLDLDKNKHPAAPGDDVYFADMGPKSPFDDTITPKPQMPGRQGFGEAAEFFRLLSLLLFYDLAFLFLWAFPYPWRTILIWMVNRLIRRIRRKILFLFFFPS